MNENLADEIRKTIESIKDMKIQVGGINNYLSILEGMMRADIQKKVDEAYQRGFEDGKGAINKGCEGCEYEGRDEFTAPCKYCANRCKNHWTAKKQDDEIKVGDEVTDIQSGANFLVTHLWESNHGDKGVSGFNNDCSAFSATLDKVSKTGRHFDIEGILREMRE